MTHREWLARVDAWFVHRPCPLHQFKRELAQVQKADARAMARRQMRGDQTPLNTWERLWVEWHGAGRDYFPPVGWVGSQLVGTYVGRGSKKGVGYAGF